MRPTIHHSVNAKVRRNGVSARLERFFVSQAVVGRQQAGTAATGAFAVLVAISFCHLLNDLAQSLVPAIYPLLKSDFDLSFSQIGLITLVFQGIASLFQPLVGLYTDKKPQPYSLTYGMGCTLIGMCTIAFASSYLVLLAGAALLGFGASIFHPEASRVARLASGGAHGFAQSLFQVGGSFGSSIGPVLAAFVIVPRGQESLAWFALIALGGMVILAMLGNWYRNAGHAKPNVDNAAVPIAVLPAAQVRRAIAVLVALIFSKYFYLSSITSYYIFYLMQRFTLSAATAQIDLFVFLAASAAGTFIGGPVGDRFGRKAVIWVSILGVLPFTLALPYVGLTATIVLSVAIGLILSSAFSAIVVYAQELMPGRIGMVSGLFFGVAFGMAGVGAAVLGELADFTSIELVYRVCSFLPAIGLLTALLPNVEGHLRVAPASAQ
jgi:FSR family fosmidomycin resistance protein-like MFS transporter